MKKLALFMMITFFSCLSANSATAYLIEFDNEGAQAYDSIDRWVLEAQELENTDLATYGEIFTYQDKTSGDFTENFTMDILKGKNGEADPSIDYPYDNLTIDIFLEGNFAGPAITDTDPTITFSNGSASIEDIDSSTTIGTLDLNSALDTTVEAGVIGDENLQLSMDLVFTFNDDLDPNYFGPDEVDLAGKSWLLSFVGGRINQDALYDGADYEDVSNDEYVIEWNVSGETLDAEFTAVPEPTTMLLFGSGLIGLAAVGRKKYFRK